MSWYSHRQATITVFEPEPEAPPAAGPTLFDARGEPVETAPRPRLRRKIGFRAPPGEADPEGGIG